MTANKRKAAGSAAPELPLPKSRQLEIQTAAGKSKERLMADVITSGVATNAITASRFVNVEVGEVSLTEMVASIRDLGDAINRGDLTRCEAMLGAQAVALNAMFAELARRATLQFGSYPETMERYMRLALKAQAQSRATVETLAAMKNPPVVFARQANINHGGQQQVNNGATPTTPGGVETSASIDGQNRTTSHPDIFSPALKDSKPAELVGSTATRPARADTRAPAGFATLGQSELLEGNHGQRMDT